MLGPKMEIKMTVKNEITIPEKASIAEYKALLADARAQEAGIETIFAILDKIAAKEARIDLIAKTESFKPTQAKLFVRRSSDDTILSVVPETDVFDDIAVQKIKKKATGNKRIVTTDKELKDYQALMAAGVTDIIYDKDKERIVAKPVVVADPPNKDGGSDGEDAGATEVSATNEG
jgi:hypothetical protein